MSEGQFTKFQDGVSFARGNDVIAGSVLLQHQPHGVNVVGGISPVATSVEPAKTELGGQAKADPRRSIRNLSRDEFEPTAGTLMVIEDGRACKEPFVFAV